MGESQRETKIRDRADGCYDQAIIGRLRSRMLWLHVMGRSQLSHEDTRDNINLHLPLTETSQSTTLMS